MGQGDIAVEVGAERPRATGCHPPERPGRRVAVAVVGADGGDRHGRADRIEVVIEPFRSARDLIVTIPGISTGVADVIIAETGADMSRFPTAGHLASWAGTWPGSNEPPHDW